MTDQAIIAALAKVQVEKVANCDACSGGGIVYYIHGCGTCGTPEKSPEICNCPPCPTCAPIRELDLRVHGITGGEYQPTMNNVELYNLYCSCGDTIQYFRKVAHNHPSYSQELHDNLNPDLTTHREGSKLWLVHCLITLGEWEKFVGDMNDGIDLACFSDPEHDCKCYMKVADILTDGKNLVPAIEEYLKEREG